MNEKVNKITQKYLCDKTNKRLRIKERNISEVTYGKINSVSIEVSILNKFCSGDFLIATLNWVKQWNIPIEFSLGDILQRYNLRTHYIHIEEPLLENKLDHLIKLMSKEWFESNSIIIKKELNGYDYKINNWWDWLKHPEYKNIYTHLQNYVYASETHRQALEKDIQRISKRPNWLSGSNVKVKRSFLTQYMFEEITVYCLQNIDKSTLHIYPGGSSFLLKSLHLDNQCTLPFFNRRYINFTFRGEGQNSYQDLSEWLKVNESI